MLLLLMSMLPPAARAQSPASLLEGTSALQECIDDAACGRTLTGLLAENMAEYGFVQQADPIATSPLGGKGMGTVVEVRLDSLPLGPKNELERLVSIPPALPRLAVGYQHGSYTFDNPYAQLAMGVTVLPPVRLFGGTLLGAQVDAGAATRLASDLLFGGIEVGYGYGQLAAPLVGAREQLEQIDAFEAFVRDIDTTCEQLGTGCLDRFRQHVGHLRAGLSFDPIPAVFTYCRVALTGLSQRLDVALDDTVWGSDGVQGQLHLGAGLRTGDRYQLAFGAAMASRPGRVPANWGQPMTKLVGSTSFRFGRKRYWERDLPPGERLE